MNLNSNIYYSNQKLFNIDLNIISWCNIKAFPQNLSSIVPTITINNLNDIPPITSVISNEKKIDNYDNLINQEWTKQSCNLFTLANNNLSIDGNIECSDFILNNSNIKNFSSNISINNYNISTNGTINSVLNDSNSYYIIFTSNGYLNLPQDLICDIIIVGAGGNGGNAQYNNEFYNDGLLYELPASEPEIIINNYSSYKPINDINDNTVFSGYNTNIVIANNKVGAGIYEIYYSSYAVHNVNALRGQPPYWIFIKSNTFDGLVSRYLYTQPYGTYIGSRFLELNDKGEWIIIKSTLPFVVNRVLVWVINYNYDWYTLGNLHIYGSNNGYDWI